MLTPAQSEVSVGICGKGDACHHPLHTQAEQVTLPKALSSPGLAHRYSATTAGTWPQPASSAMWTIMMIQALPSSPSLDLSFPKHFSPRTGSQWFSKVGQVDVEDEGRSGSHRRGWVCLFPSCRRAGRRLVKLPPPLCDHTPAGNNSLRQQLSGPWVATLQSSLSGQAEPGAKESVPCLSRLSLL